MGDFEEMGSRGGRGRGGFRGRGRGGGGRGRGGRSGGGPEGPIDQLKLYVGSLSWGVDDAALQEEFSKFGPCEVRRAGDDWNPVPARACLAFARAVHLAPRSAPLFSCAPRHQCLGPCSCGAQRKIC